MRKICFKYLYYRVSVGNRTVGGRKRSEQSRETKVQEFFLQASEFFMQMKQCIRVGIAFPVAFQLTHTHSSPLSYDSVQMDPVDLAHGLFILHHIPRAVRIGVAELPHRNGSNPGTMRE